MAEKILFTRSKDQNKSLVRVANKLGYESVEIQLLELVNTSRPRVIQLIKKEIGSFDMFIFISPHAVNSGIQILLENEERMKDDALFVAVGESTAAELYKHVPSVLFPEGGVGGEALMKTQEMQDVKGKRILIVRGQDGKPWLGSEIIKRGGKVDFFDCYKRKMPRFLSVNLKQSFSEKMFDICFLHSAHAAINLFEASAEMCQEVLTKKAVVGSRDIERLLLQLGWKGPINVAKTPTNKDMMAALMPAS